MRLPIVSTNKAVVTVPSTQLEVTRHMRSQGHVNENQQEKQAIQGGSQESHALELTYSEIIVLLLFHR